jgi:hypothetical protein
LEAKNKKLSTAEGAEKDRKGREKTAEVAEKSLASEV